MHYYIKLAIRLTLAILLALFYQIYYIIFSPPTFYLTYFTLKIFQLNPIIEANRILLNSHILEFVPACVAASAYLLLTLLILLTKDLSIKKSIYLFIAGSLLILAANLIRIDILILILLNSGHNIFQSLHLFFWKILSTLYIAGVWIFLVYKFKIKTIPIFSDYQALMKEIKNSNSD